MGAASHLGRGYAFSEIFRRVTGERKVHRWNDAPGRTYEDVILLLKQIEAGDVDST